MDTVTQHPLFLFVRIQNTLHRINYKDICYIQAEGNYCYIMTSDNNKYVTKISLRQLQERLPEGEFIRIHKSFVLNLYHLVKINTKERLAYLNAITLPIGRTFLNDLTASIMIL